MDIKDLALDDLLNQQDAKANDITLVKADDATPQGSKEVAIIGVSARIGAANDLNTFWDMLAKGEMGTRDLPEARKAAFEEYLHLRGVFHRISEQDYQRESFLDDIDRFDYRFFGMSKQEANLMDPNQRLFLQTGWSALEDAGYGGDSIRGSKTGVFVGYSADFGQDYRHIIHTFAPDAPEIAVAGNVKSIIASRLAYQLDLRGPTMMIDTACSSGLVCVHQAIRSIRNNECDMAIAGAVKVDFLPVMDRENIGVGTKDIQDTIAADERTKTFDDFSDGTSAAEGVLAFVLKSYDQALADGDNILAVVAGSAVNQDGLSVGITAPNSEAQARLIQDALQDAEMEPEHISYIEAHGTATRLGDPIEVAGISSAFSRFTQRKQFCGIGSVKTNIGHMDNGAGLAGLSKVLLSLQHQQLPPSLNFNTPNRNIPFEQSPVYVNDVLRPWDVQAGQVRAAGINSFGLSGTNCHVIVREHLSEPHSEQASHTAPANSNLNHASQTSSHVLLLSAINTEALIRQANNYLAHLNSDAGQQQRWQDICYTAALGRLHHVARLAIVADSHQAGVAALTDFLEQANSNDGALSTSAAVLQSTTKASINSDALAQHNQAWLFNQFKVVAQASGNANELTESEQHAFTQLANDLIEESASASTSAVHSTQNTQDATAHTLKALQLHWVCGANPDWATLFANVAQRVTTEQSKNTTYSRVTLPTYPFAQESCWVEATVAAEKALNQGASAKTFNHPLLDQCVVDSFGFHLYRVNLSAQKHWELADHIVKGVCVLPGTCYIEIMLQVALQLRGAHYHDHPWPLVFERVQFLSPFGIYPKENRDLHIQVQEDGQSRYNIRIVSRDERGVNAHARDLDWEVHAEATIKLTETAPETGVINPDSLIPSFSRHLLFSQADDARKGLNIGDRWNHSFVDGWHKDDMSEFMVKLALPAPFSHEGQIYAWHPALLDVAVNAANHVLGDGDLFLPFSYKNFSVMNKLPDELFVYFTTKNSTDELYTFDIRLMDKKGVVCGRIDEYTIKRVPESESFDQAPTHPQVFALRAVEAHRHNENTVSGNAGKTDNADNLDSLDNPDSPADSIEAQTALNTQINNNPVLFIHNGQATQTALLDSLNHQLGQVIDLAMNASNEAHPAAHSKTHSEVNSQGSIQALLQSVQEHQFSAIIYAGALSEGFKDDGVNQLSDALAQVTHWINGLVQEKIVNTGPTYVLTAQGVSAPLDNEHQEQIEPDQAAIAAFVRIAGMENPQLNLACLDVSRADLRAEPQDTQNREWAKWLLDSLLKYNADTNKQSQMVWHRNSAQLSQQLELLNLDRQGHMGLTGDGVYVITGGTGALGMELAWYLTQQFDAHTAAAQNGGSHLKLALIGTRALPDEATWPQRLSDSSTDAGLRQKLTQLQAIRATGAKVSCHAVDLADATAVEALTSHLREQHGRINGVVHAAGRAGAGYLMKKTESDIHQVVDGKALGAWHLHQATLNDELQFFVMYSSIATVLRNPGQSDYTAANSFLDALAEYRRDKGLPALSIGWPAWRETGIAVEWNAVDEDEFFAPINTKEALDLLARAVHAKDQLPASIVLASLNQNARLQDIQQLGLSASPALERHLSQHQNSAATAVVASAGDMSDVVLKGISDPDDIDMLVAGAWRKVLGMSEFDYEENLNDLGGNSILTTQLYKEFDQLHPGMMEMADLFSLTTIKTQAEQLKKNLGYSKSESSTNAVSGALSKGSSKELSKEASNAAEAQAEEENMDDILAKLASGELSAEEAQELL